MLMLVCQVVDGYSRPEAPAHELDEHLHTEHESERVVDALEHERVLRHLKAGERRHVVPCAVGSPWVRRGYTGMSTRVSERASPRTDARVIE